MSEDKEARGLWIGVPVPKNLVPEANELSSWLPKKEPHITLVHLGRTSNEYIVRHVLSAFSNRELPQVVALEVTGVGYFWRNGFSVKVALINSAELFDLRASVLKILTDGNVDYDRKFGFIPHITLSSNAQLSDRGVPFKLAAPGPKLVWGDKEFAL